MKCKKIQNLNKKKDDWLYEISNSLTKPRELLNILNLKNHPEYYSSTSNNLFPFRVPLSFVLRMKKNDPKDPLLLQVITNKKEFLYDPKYKKDPVQEIKNIVLPGLLHKYYDRVLLLVKTNCAINCRYCFRRCFPYQDNQGNKKNWIQTLNYINQNQNLNEIILSGGDPLMAKDHELSWLITSISKIKHIKRIRIHTRLPVVIPSRITEKICEIFIKSSVKIILVTHINHPQEINSELSQSLLKLTKSNVILLNQSVLLKNINDNAVVLSKLSNLLFQNNVLPYYLNILDKVIGTKHFAVSIKQAKDIISQLMKITSGFLVPKLVYDSGSKNNKSIII